MSTPNLVGVSAARFIKWIRIGQLYVEPGSWLLVNHGTSSFIVRVEEMAAVTGGVTGGGNMTNMVTLWCGSAHAQSVSEESDGMIRVTKVECPGSVRVDVQPTVGLTELSCIDRGDHLEFRYLF